MSSEGFIKQVPERARQRKRAPPPASVSGHLPLHESGHAGATARRPSMELAVKRYPSFADCVQGLHNMLGMTGNEERVSERTLRLLWRRSEGFFITVKNIVVKVRQVRSTSTLDEAVLRFVLFPHLLPDVACKIPREILETVAKLAEERSFRFLERVRVEYLIDDRVPLRKRIAYIEHLAMGESGQSLRKSRGIGSIPNSKSVERPAEKSRLFLPLVSEDIRERLPRALKDFIQAHVPQRLSVAIDDDIALCLLNMETPENMCMLLRRALDYLEHHENQIPKEQGVTAELAYAIERVIEGVLREIILLPGDSFHASSRLQWFRPQPVTDEDWQRWCEVLDRDCDTWLRISCQELDPADEVTDEDLNIYCEHLQHSFLTEALQQGSNHALASQAEGDGVTSTNNIEAAWSCTLRDEENQSVEIAVRVPFLDKRRLAEERARFPKELCVQGREFIDDPGIARLFGAASVIFALTPAAEAHEANRSRFRHLCRELASARQAARVPIPQTGRMLLIVPISERIVASNPELRRYPVDADVLLACRVRVDP